MLADWHPGNVGEISNRDTGELGNIQQPPTVKQHTERALQGISPYARTAPTLGDIGHGASGPFESTLADYFIQGVTIIHTITCATSADNFLRAHADKLEVFRRHALTYNYRYLGASDAILNNFNNFNNTNATPYLRFSTENIEHGNCNLDKSSAKVTGEH